LFFRIDFGGAETFYALLAVAPRDDLPPRCHNEPRGGDGRLVLLSANLLHGACPYYRKGPIIHALEADRIPW